LLSVSHFEIFRGLATFVLFREVEQEDAKLKERNGKLSQRA
jgi:hypothetical protein